jgi:hypothetical protein
MDASYVMGLDLGPPGEPTGFAALEWPATNNPTPQSEYHLRHLERFPPGTPYPTIMDAVADRTSQPTLKSAPLVVDVTAVGRAVVNRVYAIHPRIIPVAIGAGLTTTWVEFVGQSVPKKELVTALQMALQTRRLKIAPGLPDAEVLSAELSAFRLRKVSINEADAAEWRVGRYDDLVFAVALACWFADQYPPLPPEPPRPPVEARRRSDLMNRDRSKTRARLFPNGM